MKQSPFKFQGNNSQQAKKGAKANLSSEPDDKKGKLTPTPKNLKPVQSRSKSAPQIRTGRTGNASRPKAGG